MRRAHPLLDEASGGKAHFLCQGEDTQKNLNQHQACKTSPQVKVGTSYSSSGERPYSWKKLVRGEWKDFRKDPRSAFNKIRGSRDLLIQIELLGGMELKGVWLWAEEMLAVNNNYEKLNFLETPLHAIHPADCESHCYGKCQMLPGIWA